MSSNLSFLTKCKGSWSNTWSYWRFDSSNGFRVLHIGWNALQVTVDSEILEDVGNRHVYFVHSYRAMPSDKNKEWVSSTCHYGDNFITSIRRGNVHAVQFHPEKSGDVGLSVLRRFLNPSSNRTKKAGGGKASKLAKRVIACLDVRANDKGDLVVTKGDQYDVRNLGKPVELDRKYYKDGADEISFLDTTGSGDFPLGDLPMLQVSRCTSENVFVPLTVGGGIRDFTDSDGRHYSSLEVASEYFSSVADKISFFSFVFFGEYTGQSPSHYVKIMRGITTPTKSLYKHFLRRSFKNCKNLF
ncbi:hypothetical protein K1719_020799 [Acacia pycnantha]|nr:hypothetical protein K1719_020799 [Acacia pycnantha]